jgi:alkylation response protein AidB-like acyl-CoA dehydrogenase
LNNRNEGRRSRHSAADGLATLRLVIDEAIAATCAEAVGTMERAHEITVEYLKQRKQFGVAIGSAAWRTLPR